MSMPISAATRYSVPRLQSVRALSMRRPWRWGADVALDWLVIAAAMTAAILSPHIVVYILAAIVIGNRQHALGILGHEGAHKAVHSRHGLNDFLSNLFCFWPLLLTVTGYRNLHMMHHKDTGTAADPELMHKQARAPQWDLPLKPLKLALFALKDCVGFALPDFLIIVTFSKPTRLLQLLPVILLHVCIVAVCIHTYMWIVPVLWYASLLTTFMMFFRFRLWLEHQGVEETNRLDLTPLEGAVLAPHNIWLHWEHHAFPSVPYYNLPRLRIALGGPPAQSLASLFQTLRTTAYRRSGAPFHESAQEA